MINPQNAILPGTALGVTIGEVSDTRDPKNLGRVKIKYQLKGSEVETDWVQIMSFYAGQEYGAFFMPQAASEDSVGDSALLAFEGGDPSKPYVLGFLYNGVLKPPVIEVEKQQTLRMIKTKSGKLISFDDSSDEKITIADNKDNSIVLDTQNNAIAVTSKGDLTISAEGTLNIKANTVNIENNSGGVKIELGDSGIKVNGGTSLKMNATMIDLN